MQKKIHSFLIGLFLFPILSYGQSSGSSTYAFLNLPFSARSIAMGGNFLSIYDNDISLALSNPSLISAEMNNKIDLSFVDYFSDINYGSVSYGLNLEKLGTFIVNMQFIDYGKFEYATETGERLGSFTAGDYAMSLGWSRPISPNIIIGANLKGLYSNYESYNSFGLAVDVAATYLLEKRNISASLIFRNIGTQIKTFTPQNSEDLPFEIQAGFSKALEHLPLRFSLLLTQLQKWDLTYDEQLINPNNQTIISGEETSSGKIDDFADNLMRHIVIGVELSPIKALSLRLGYNYLKRKEMTIPARLSTVGFSWGFGVNIYKFRINYARNAQHLSPSPNYFSVTTDLDQIIGK
ncbi:MAG: type IX secretion system protein PorQ [Bacteroidota bacterium]